MTRVDKIIIQKDREYSKIANETVSLAIHLVLF